MDFLILGPLEAWDGGRKLPLGGVRQRALLAMLLLHANEVVSSDRLVDALWDGAARRDALKALSVAVARLRKVLAPGPLDGGAHRVLVTRPPGYALRLDPEQLDARRFERLVAEGRAAADPAAAARSLGDALALWRGGALADLAYESFCRPEIARLEELRLVALEDRVDADLALGGGAGLVAELEGIVEEHPLRERFRGQLLLALYRAGRQADALEAYRAARATLVEELGIEPGRRMRELHQAILRQDADLDRPPPAPRVPAGSGRVFVGREREQAALLAGLDAAFAGSGRLFLLSGEPGIGKSRLAEELAARARTRGARVLVGRCWEAGGAPAYWPWIQALRAYVRERDAGALRAELGAGAADMVQVMPELGERLPELPPPTEIEPELARFRLFDASAQFLRAASAEQPIVLLLDDLHAADAPSLLLLRFLARELAGSRLLVLGAFRDVHPRPEGPLVDLLAETAREPGTHRIELAGLTEPEIAEYLDLAAPEPAPPRLAAVLHGRTEGNPLFVGELLRLLSIEGAVPIGEHESRLEVPQSVRDVIARRMTHLSPESVRMLVLASVLGREFRLDVLGRLGGVRAEDPLEWLDEAIGAGVVSEVPGSPDRLRFAHVLFRDTLYNELTAARRMRLHERVVAALEGLDEAPLAELAHHAIAAGDHAQGLRHARAAAARALEGHAYEEAARLFELALEALELGRAADPATRCTLLIACGDALASAGRTAESKDRFLEAAAAARTEGRPELLARAALGYGGMTTWQRAGDDTRIVPLLEEALSALGEADLRLRARLLARLAGALRDEPSLEPRTSLGREAVEIARGLGDDDTLAAALASFFLAGWGPDVDVLVPIADELHRLARATGTPATVLDALTMRSIIAWMTLVEVDAATLDDRYDELADELGHAAAQWQAAMQNVVWAVFKGDFATAERLAEHALSYGDARRADADCSYRLAMFVLRREQGRLAEIDGLLREAVDAYPGYRSFRCFIPLLELELGHEQAARHAFGALASGGFESLPRDGEWLFCLALLAEVAVALGDAGAATELYRQLLPYARVNAMAAGEVAIGPVARFLGILAAATGRPEAAAGHFEDAIAMTARLAARPWLAHAQDGYARALLARGGPGDRDRARELLSACTATYRELGMDRWADAVAGLGG